MLKCALREKQYDEEVEASYCQIAEEEEEKGEWKCGLFIGSGSFG